MGEEYRMGRHKRKDTEDPQTGSQGAGAGEEYHVSTGDTEETPLREKKDVEQTPHMHRGGMRLQGGGRVKPG